MQYHPETDWLIEYSAGALNPALSFAVAAHLHYCSVCRDKVHSLQAAGAKVMDMAEQVEVSTDLLDKTLLALENEVELPEALEPSAPLDFGLKIANCPAVINKLLTEQRLHWRRLTSSLSYGLLSLGDETYQTSLHHIKAQGHIPKHDHQGLEVTLVLQGGFSDQLGDYRPGDFVVRAPGEFHEPHGDKHEDCYALSVVAGPVKLLHGWRRLLNPFLGIKPR